MPSTYRTSKNDYVMSFPEGREWLQYQEYPSIMHAIDDPATEEENKKDIFASEKNLHTYSVMSHNE